MKIFGIILILLIAHFSLLLTDAGYFYKPKISELNNCVTRIDIIGPEDFAVSKSGELFISSADRTNPDSRQPFSGKIFKFRGKTEFLSVHHKPQVAMTSNPHGIDIWENEHDLRLYVISHRQQNSVVEIYDRDLNKLNTIQDSQLYNLNDIYPVGPNEFYVTHDHGFRSRWIKKIENYSRLGRGFISYYNGKKWKIVAQNISYANGITGDRSGKFLFVAAMLEKKIYVYRVNTDRSLEKFNIIRLPFAPDNLSWINENEMLVATHTKVFDLAAHEKNNQRKSSFAILKITSPTTIEPKISTLIENDGSLISGVSSAQAYVDKLLLGAIFQTKLLICDLSSFLEDEKKSLR